MVYPASALVVSIIITTIILLFAIPAFKDLLQSFEAELLPFTQFVLNMSAWINNWWWLCLALLISSILAFNYFKKRSPAFYYFIDKLYLKIPIIGILALFYIKLHLLATP